MPNIIGRWRAGHTDWLPVPPYEIILERVSQKWLLHYFVYGERHALIGFDTEEEARRELAWLKTRFSMPSESWVETVPDNPDQ